MSQDANIVLKDVSKFYGEVLGVNHVDLTLEPGITGLVGPNGSGKSTLMNLMTGLLQPSRGSIHVVGIAPDHPEQLFRRLGYCTQYDSFPKGATGYSFINGFLRIHGYSADQAYRLTYQALEKVNLVDAAARRVRGYSKGMRQRVKLAQAIAHNPEVMILDEPLNGLDPLARAEVIDLFRDLAEMGRHVIISSHVLHELDIISDNVVMLTGGYVVAEGDVHGVREEVSDVPIQIVVRCDKPSVLAQRAFKEDSVVEVRMHDDGGGLHLRTRDSDQFYLLLNRVVLEEQINVETVAPADDDVQSVYQYLIGSSGGQPA
ncbi:MAG TPA: ABC transporter ATP-binding protein [Acidobacteriota bacterium]|nr:ABC transporter ATP-binding protein [Acidobacteriota bacterium]